MKAAIGDRIVVRGHHVGEHERGAEIIDLRGVNGEPPYLVRWDDDGQEALFFPGSDAAVEHHPKQTVKR